jgi:hypothetical protein
LENAVGDPGDETQRAYRYQHSYGVILLLKAARELGTSGVLWCEHHEDYLLQKGEHAFRAFQIKTRTPENGAWRMLDAGMVRSIGRFAELLSTFGGAIRECLFVSNADFDRVGADSTDDTRKAKCPELFLSEIRRCESLDAIEPPFDSVFQSLVAQCGCDPQLLFDTLRLCNLIKGPARDDIDAILSHDHIAAARAFTGMEVPELDRARDWLVSAVFGACSLRGVDRERHTYALLGGGQTDPNLLGKRLVPHEQIGRAREILSRPAFEFVSPPIVVLTEARAHSQLEWKMGIGGLSDYYSSMRDRAIAAERHLLREQYRRQDGFEKMQRQLEQIVIGAADDAHLRARRTPAPFGQEMLIQLQDTLRDLSSNGAEFVYNQTYDCLVGIAGLLSEECRIWWSERVSSVDTAGNAAR